MKQLLPKLKKINCKKLISKKKSQIDRATMYTNLHSNPDNRRIEIRIRRG